MKLIINYDVLEKIYVAKNGISLKRIIKDTSCILSMYTPFTIGVNILQNSKEEIIPELLFGIGLYSFMHTLPELIFSSKQKELTKDELQILATDLKKINVDTTADLLLESKKYKTEYELLEKNDNALRKLQINNYILVPTQKDEEISVLQEHVIGTDEYCLSVGEPQKVYQLKPMKNLT